MQVSRFDEDFVTDTAHGALLSAVSLVVAMHADAGVSGLKLLVYAALSY
jgi:hypothetical protein